MSLARWRGACDRHAAFCAPPLSDGDDEEDVLTPTLKVDYVWGALPHQPAFSRTIPHSSAPSRTIPHHPALSRPVPPSIGGTPGSEHQRMPPPALV